MPAPSIKHALAIINTLSAAALLAIFAASCVHSSKPRIIENSACRLAIDVEMA